MLKTLFYTIFFILAVGFIFKATPWYSQYSEHVAPVIALEDLPGGLGINPQPIIVTAVDAGAGLDEIVVRIRQRARSAELVRKSFHGESEASISLTMQDLPFALEDGRLDFEVDAFDRSYFSNRGSKEFSLTVDRTAPSIEAVTTQHNLRQGGAQLVVYRARDKHLQRSGVLVNDLFFEGVKDSECSRDLPQGKDLYCALYSLPLNAPASREEIKLVAYDATGNESKATFYNRVAKRFPRTTSVSVSNAFLARTGNLIRDQALSEQAAIDSHKSFPPESLSVPLGSKAFKKPNGTIISAFGDAIKYMLSGQVQGQRLNLGYEFTGLTDVTASSAGQVAFVGEVPALGKVVVLDHGLKLSSVYGYLGEALVHLNQSVEAGQVIAKAGETGLARMPGLYFEILINGVPVDANEWWTDSWYSTHIVDKVRESAELSTLLSVH